MELYWKKLCGPLLDRVSIRLHIDQSEEERKEYTLEELQFYVKRATEESRRIGTSFRDITVEQIQEMIPVNVFERLTKIAEKKELSYRRRYDLCRVWITIVSAFGDSEEKYFEDIDKAVELMGNFKFPN